MTRWLLLLALPAVVLAQGTSAPRDEKKKKKTAGEVEIPDPGTPIEAATVARQQVTRFQKEFKAAGKDEHGKVKLLRKLGDWDHAFVLKEAKRHLRDKSHIVATAAAVVIARQASDAKAAGSLLLKALRREKRTNVVCAMIVGMGRLGYDDRAALKEVDKHFRQATKERHKAATRYYGYIQAKDKFRALAEKLDEPVAKNPDDPNNPPASWWKERWHEWNSNVPYTRWALSQIVPGETFETTAEAKQWAETVGKEHGIEWK